MLRLFFFLCVLIAFGCIFSSCRKDLVTSNPSDQLSFSIDTLTFDTVFTSVGSATRYFKVINSNNKKIKVSNIRLINGSSSYFRLNIDGRQVDEISNVEIPAKDSIYIFASVTVDPNLQDNPFVIYDSVMFESNGNEQRVILQAWGQNAHFYNGVGIETQTWINDKPYVIVNSILVDSNQTLTIQPGCRIYMHGNSYFFVQGTLKVLGQQDDSVIFRGDRLEQFYVDLPGQWEGIWFLRSSHDNEINYALIKETNNWAIRVDSLRETANFKLTLRNSIIRYSFGYGILSLTGDIYGENCLIHSCGSNDIAMGYGGTYHFEDCTLADYSSAITSHNDPVVLLSNFYSYTDSFGVTQYKTADLNAIFKNCIVYGSLEKEIDLESKTSSLFNFSFDHCLLKVNSDIDTTTSSFSQDLFNIDDQSLFTDPFQKDDYHLKENSPCINAGVPNDIAFDLEGNIRADNPDIGCYEFIK
ncbi:MAG: hypothetical protein H0W62_03795 [Chitinophagales bacterium]|nr:hypothetical protein [Chitinophagales bacterium]